MQKSIIKLNIGHKEKQISEQVRIIFTKYN